MRPLKQDFHFAKLSFGFGCVVFFYFTKHTTTAPGCFSTSLGWILAMVVRNPTEQA